MAYQKQTWENLPSTNTPITASRLNHIEDGIEGVETEMAPVTTYTESNSKAYSCNYANDNFSGKGEILWENSNPTSSVADGTTATLSSDDYDYIIWLYCYNTNPANTNIQKSSVCLKGKSAMMNIIGYSTGGLMRRVADYTNDTTYTFRSAYNDTTINNDYCIPLYAIGGKF